MDLRTLDFQKPQFTQRAVSLVTPVDADTFDNWARFGHIPYEKVGNRRIVSAATVIECAVIHSLANTLRVPPQVAAPISREIVSFYLATTWYYTDLEFMDIERPVELQASPVDFVLSIVRDADGNIRVVDADAPEIDAVTLSLPVRTIARRVMLGIAALETAGG